VFFKPNFAVSNKVEETFFSKIKIWEVEEANIGSLNCLVGHQSQKITARRSMGSRKLYHSNIKVVFLDCFYNELPYSKLHKN
jgi:hypothetical protein